MNDVAKKQPSPWGILAGATVVSMFGTGPAYAATLGLFIIPMTEELG